MTTVTENEAKDRWCPFSRINYAGIRTDGKVVAVSNRDKPVIALANLDDHNMCMCIGSRCMAWRWEERTDRIPQFGHCGLAGRPT